MTEFQVGAIAYATDFDESGVAAPMCFKRKKATVEPVIDQDDRVSGAANAGHDGADHRRFIVRRDNDPGIANPAGHVRLVSRAGGVLLKTTRIASNRFTGMANRLPVGLAAILRPSIRPTWKAISENGTNFQG